MSGIIFIASGLTLRCPFVVGGCYGGWVLVAAGIFLFASGWTDRRWVRLAGAYLTAVAGTSTAVTLFTLDAPGGSLLWPSAVGVWVGLTVFTVALASFPWIVEPPDERI